MQLMQPMLAYSSLALVAVEPSEVDHEASWDLELVTVLVLH